MAAAKVHQKMTNASLAIPEEEVFDGLIPDSVQVYLDLCLTTITLTVVSATGVVTNVINLVVLVKQGIKDCVTVCLISLALTDLGASSVVVMYGPCLVIAERKVFFYLDPSSLSFIISWTSKMFADLTMGITAFISVERSLCVLMPFKFKDLVTFQRAIFVTVVIYVVVLACYMPILATFGVSEQWDPTFNRSRLLLWLSEDRSEIEKAVNIYQNSVISVVCLFIVLVSTQGMIFGLRRSTRFQAKKSTGEDSTTTKKNNAVVKMVASVAIIYIASNTIRLLLVMSRRLFPKMSFQDQYHNLYMTANAVFLICGAMNSAANIFVYYIFKPNFKETFHAIFGCK